jgi:hypothetical protein
VRFLVISEPPSHGDRVPCTARPEKSVGTKNMKETNRVCS